MIPEDVEALALADAIGALDADEQRELRSLVAALSPEGQAEVAGLYDVAVSMASAAPSVDPPAHVRERLMAAIAAPAAPPSNYTLLSS